MSAITVIARAKAKEGCESLLEKAVRVVVGPTHAEAGCLKYSLHRSVEDPSVFVMIERWSSKEALDRHLGSPHIQELFKKLPELVVDPPVIQVFQLISEGLPEKSNL